MVEQEKRIVVCPKCGTLYDLHYIDDVEIRKDEIVRYKCKNCGWVDKVIKSGLSRAELEYRD